MKLSQLIHKIRIRLGLYDLRTEGAKWVARNLGDEWVDEFLENYDNLNRGIPIGGFEKTIIFLDMVERIKTDLKNV